MAKNISIVEFLNKFGDADVCKDYVIEKRFPNGFVCPFCGSEKYYNTLRGFVCASIKCKRKVSPTSQTIFDNTKIGLNTWFLMLFLMLNNKKNTSSRQAAINYGVTQKTAWGMMNKLRTLFYREDVVLSGHIEVDESFLGNGRRWKKWGFNRTKKCPILGLFERETKRVIIECVPDRSEKTLEETIKNFVVFGSEVSTDGWMGYRNLHNWYIHDYVDHSAREYVRGNTHTNNLDGIWRQLKNSIISAHHSVSESHVQEYCNEVEFRINNKHLSTMERFDIILNRAINLRKENEALVIEIKVA